MMPVGEGLASLGKPFILLRRRLDVPDSDDEEEATAGWPASAPGRSMASAEIEVILASLNQ